MKKGPLFLTLDIGGTKCVAALVDAEGTVQVQERRPPRLGRGPDEFLAGLCEMVDRVRVADVVALGIAAPGPLDMQSGSMVDVPNMPGVGVAPVRDTLAAHVKLPVFFENDANCGALAEGRFGAGRGLDDFLFLTLSTGLGGGAVCGGQLLRGTSGNGAEVGHVIVDPRGPRCGCGKVGCLEAFCGGLNLARRVANDSEFPKSSLPRIAGDATFEAKHLFMGGRAGDPLARRYLAEWIEMLARGIADLVFAFDPRRVILGTMAVQSGDLFLDELRRRVLESVWPVHRKHLEIVPAECGERIAVLAPLALAIESRERDGK